jgi:hypothetical protein
MINLSAQERDRFATWLEQEAESDDAMATQLGKLPGNYEAMRSKWNAEALAARVIARKLRSIETETLRGGR